MARKKTQPIAIATDAPLNEEALNSARDILATAQGEYTEERDVVNQLLGQIQMASSFARFADVVSLTKLKHIKETKMYRALAGKKGVDADGNEIADVGTFDGFCQALGLSRSKVDEDLANLSAFGEEALKQLSSLGVGYRELRQYRRLPDDQKLALIEVAKAGDKEAFVELAEEIIAKNLRDKDDLTKQLSEARNNSNAKDEIIRTKNDKIDSLDLKLRSTLKRVKEAAPDTISGEICAEATRYAFEAEIAMRGNLFNAFSALREHEAAHGGSHVAFMAGLLIQLERTINELREEHHIPPIIDGDLTPEWARG